MSPVRDIVIRKLNDILIKTGNEGEENEKKMKNVEIAIYNYTIAKSPRDKKNWSNTEFSECYKTKAKSILANLDPTSYVKNEYLLPKFLSGEYSYHELCFGMTHQEMYPERWEEAIAANLKNDLKQWGSIDPESIPDGAVKCRKCRSWKTTYYAMQTRSADEPMTNFATCLKCKFNWRFE